MYKWSKWKQNIYFIRLFFIFYHSLQSIQNGPFPSMISNEKFVLWFMAPEWNITLVVLFFNKCSGGKQIFTLSGKYWKLIRERGCWPGMPWCQGYPHGGRTGGIIVPIMMIVMMDVVTRPWHYGTGGYTGPATAASTPTLISVVVATPSWPHPHTTARPRASG